MDRFGYNTPMPQPPKKKSRKRLLLRVIALVLLLIVVYFLWIFVRVMWWKYHDPHETRFMTQQLTEIRKDRPKATLQQRWVAYDKISSSFKRAVVAAEDDRFTDHRGFDWEGISHALEKNLKKGEAVAGGSTISQQLAKNLFLSSERSFVRKGKEAAITMMIEATWSKKRILEVYLNVAEWGEGVFGAEAAAQHYYQIPASAVNDSQAARLAVMLPNPRRYEKHFPPALEHHAQRVQARMRYTVLPDN